jgi:excisionase family DNA binding protein
MQDMATIDISDYVNTSKAAEMLGITVDTAKKYCQNGRLNAINLGRKWLISRHSIENYDRNRRDYNRRD